MYEWLLDYQKLSDEIDYLEYQLDREKRELKRWTSGDLMNVKLHEQSIASGLEERIEAMEYELAHKINDLHDAKKLISTFKGLENQILYYKYVKGMTLSEVADVLGYTQGHIYNKHAEIMKRINFAYQINLS
ncbi:sigma factor-like helix-turn-helix DNA-binding protein [Gracilibacillus dipsosauri]|uniref:sigma factor-like helix-turn-helix DNA-binding protein n=1 Tax=Gracilibacillus dipsosauri TaxID=178340 RepID=UPI002408FFB9